MGAERQQGTELVRLATEEARCELSALHEALSEARRQLALTHAELLKIGSERDQALTRASTATAELSSTKASADVLRQTVERLESALAQQAAATHSRGPPSPQAAPASTISPDAAMFATLAAIMTGNAAASPGSNGRYEGHRRDDAEIQARLAED